jgi:glycosyltransferase involved in cell wall biosynthesis
MNSTYSYLYNKAQRRIKGYITLTPHQAPIGRVLFIYFTDAFTQKPGYFSNRHANYWEAYHIAALFLEQGYIVDVIDTKAKLALQNTYDIIFDTLDGIEHYKHTLKPWGKTIFYFLTSEPHINNTAEQSRLNALFERKNVRLASQRAIPLSKSFTLADFVCGLGNKTTQSTYYSTFPECTSKPIYEIPGSTAAEYPEFTRNWSTAKNSFLFLSGGGMVHKGLDILLEVFAKHPELHLHVCAPVAVETDFYQAYKKELTDLPNISCHGRIDIDSPEFTTIAQSCGFLIYPSCAEGQSGAVITAMHAGLIPIITPQSGIDNPFGFMLNSVKHDDILSVIRRAQQESTQQLQQRSSETRTLARSTYTRSSFLKAFSQFIRETICSKPSISVIIPAHNSAETIAIAIESMLAQTLQPHEIVIVDDHSTDSTKQVVENISKSHPQVRYYALPWDDPKRFNKFGRNINAGYQARNFGFTQITGDWVTFQDADDASLKNRLEVQYALALRLKATHLCLDWQQFDESLLNSQALFDEQSLAVFLNDPHVTIRPHEIYSLSQKTKGLCHTLFGSWCAFLPFEFKQIRFINKLFMPHLTAYPGTGNSPLFRRSVLEKVQFRSLKNRVWPSFVGRGADRDFNFQVAETFKNSYVCLLPLYLWRVPNQNANSVKYKKYIKPGNLLG